MGIAVQDFLNMGVEKARELYDICVQKGHVGKVKALKIFYKFKEGSK